MDKMNLPGIGMRKIKSLLAVSLSFVIWQVVRIWLPQLEVHPLFGYVYSIIEMRDSAEKTKKFSKYRIKATLLGLAMGLSALPLSVRFGAYAGSGIVHLLADMVIILSGILITLWLAELLGCENLCGIAAVIFVICLVRDRNSAVNIYLYAILRVCQTLLGIFSAWAVNTRLLPYSGKDVK